MNQSVLRRILLLAKLYTYIVYDLYILIKLKTGPFIGVEIKSAVRFGSASQFLFSLARFLYRSLNPLLWTVNPQTPDLSARIKFLTASSSSISKPLSPSPARNLGTFSCG